MSGLLRELSLAGFILDEHSRQYQEGGRYAFAIFRSGDYDAIRYNCDFWQYIKDPSHCTYELSDRNETAGTSRAYDRELEFEIVRLKTLVIECFYIQKFDQAAIDLLEDDFCEGLLQTADTEALYGAVVDYTYSKHHAPMCDLIAAIAAPQHALIPVGGFSFNGLFMIHNSRFAELQRYLPSPGYTPPHYVTNWLSPGDITK